MSSIPITPPSGWGDDSLTRYFDEVRRNQYATFHCKRAVVVDLIGIDKQFEKFLLGAVNPRPFLPMSFFLRSHSAYRSAACAAMAGQHYEAQTLLRLCLEHGAYGFYIGDNRERWKRWMDRNDNPAAKQLVRGEFTNGKIKKHIESNSPTLGSIYEKLYERVIDFGAHPNQAGFATSSAIRESDGNVHFDTIYLHGEGLPLDSGLKTTGQVGIWVLRVAQQFYPERFQLLGIEAALAELRQRF